MTDLNAFLPYINGALGFAFRHALGLPMHHPVVKLTPKSVLLHLGGNRFRGIFYTNPQFSQAANANLDWFMRFLHRWDMAANRFAPIFNMGFDTYTSQPDETSGIDTRIDADTPTTNHDSSSLAAGESNISTNKSRSLLKFDFSSLSWVIFVQSATLSLWKSSSLSSNTRTCRVFRQKRAWVETQATWNIYSTGNSWSTAGAFGTDDCEQTDIGSLSLSSGEADGEKQWSLTASAVEQMVNGVWTNNGFLLKMDTELNDMQVFRDSNYGTAGERPKFVIEYASQDASSWWL